jgi:type IV fimbrial biogenesis protein FimT
MGQSGFTLIEAMVVVSIVAIVTVLAAPNLDLMINNNRISTASSDLQTDFTFARATAVTRGQWVGICASSSQTACTASTTWETGRIVYLDANRNNTFDAGDTILRVRDTLSGGLTLAPTTAGASLYFRPSGPSGPNTTNTFRLCKASYKGRDIVISATGRVSSTVHSTTNCP